MVDMKSCFNHLPRRFKPTEAERREISVALHLRAQLPPDDPNRLADADGAKHSWGGAFLWAIGCLWQDAPFFLLFGSFALLYTLVAGLCSWS